MPDHDGMADRAPGERAREFAAAFREFLDWIHSPASGAGEVNAVSELVREFLGPERTELSVVTRDLPRFEHVNLQTALNAWSGQAGRTVDVHGITIPPHYAGVDLQQLLGGEDLPPLRLTAPALADLPNGPGTTLGCLKLALLLITDTRGRYVMMVAGPSDHHQGLTIEIAGLP